MKIVKTRIGFVGAGNLAWNLAHNFQQGDFEIAQVITATKESASEFSSKFNVPKSGNDIFLLDPSLDVVFLVTGDKEIRKIAEQISAMEPRETLFVISSGAVPLREIEILGENTGVVYPLQTFKKDKLTQLKMVPVFIEFTPASERWVRTIAEFLSEKVKVLNSEDRLKMHLAAVFACNFPNLLWILTEKLSGSGFSFSDFEALVKQNVENVFALGPQTALTGPAKRGDAETMQKHLDLLNGKNDLQDVYRLLSEMIQKNS